MTEEAVLLHKKDRRGMKVIKAAPHPRGAKINPKEYYMRDDPGDGIGFLATAGQTHAVAYTLDLTGSNPTIICKPCENYRTLDQFWDESHQKGMITHWSKKDVIQKLENILAQVREQSVPEPENFQGMPYRGDGVWVVHPDPNKEEVVEVTVTEVAEVSGKMSVVFGFHYKPNGEWFWTKEAAEAYLATETADRKAKNVFLGEAS